MIGHIQTDEHEATAKQEICARCRKPAVPHELTGRGPLCRSCCLDATEILVHYVIDGQVYTKHLKTARLAVVASPKKRPR